MHHTRRIPIASAALAALLVILLTVSNLAQTNTTNSQRPRKVLPEEQEPVDVLRFDTDLVSVDVMVTDAEGQPVRNLRPEDFKLYSDDAEQKISFFQVERRTGPPRPLAIVFALDVSGSITAEEISRVRQALQAFAKQLANNSVLY